MGHRRSPPYPLRGAGRWGCPHTHTHSSPLPLPCGGWGGCFPPPPPGRGFCNAAGVVMHGAHRSPGPLQCLRRAPPLPGFLPPLPSPGGSEESPLLYSPFWGSQTPGRGCPAEKSRVGGCLSLPGVVWKWRWPGGDGKIKITNPEGIPWETQPAGAGGSVALFSSIKELKLCQIQGEA